MSIFRITIATAAVAAFLVLPRLCSTARAQDVSSPCLTSCAETRFIEAEGVHYAYRSFGVEDGVPLVFFQRFRGTMDEWDPALTDVIASGRHVILFDNAGVARSDGEASQTLTGWADTGAAFIAALGYHQVDVLGFSFGGLVAQELALRHPDLVRRLVIAGSGAGYVEGANLNPKAVEVATKPVNVDADFLYLFFKATPTSQAAGRAHLARLKLRADAFEKLVSAPAWQAMLAAGGDVSTPETSLLHRVGAIRQPVLVANGVEDIMIPTYQSYALAQAIPNVRLVIYPDSGHGFLFQYGAAFGAEVLRFLKEDDVLAAN
ncbi:Putative non-heme bromoperoxidase BpoC [Alphaproteobacteria bacterium SO-S41]|nr:Putative non-heme bromoperoxidase BpoC [Alphaproteobacteria bacterium SO-S41]